MPKFLVTITETNKFEYEIAAPSDEAAIEIAKQDFDCDSVFNLRSRSTGNIEIYVKEAKLDFRGLAEETMDELRRRK